MEGGRLDRRDSEVWRLGGVAQRAGGWAGQREVSTRLEPLAAGAPTVIWTDRGGAFFHGNGKITDEFKAALVENDLEHFWKDDSSGQAGKLQEVHLHETAVSWIRYRLTESSPANAWKETREQYTTRLKACCAEINRAYDVDSLCRALPRRIEALIDSEGDRINK